MVQKQVKKALIKKKKKHTEELCAFEKMCVLHSDQESLNSGFSKEGIPMFINLLTSVLRVSACTFGIGNGFAWYN